MSRIMHVWNLPQNFHQDRLIIQGRRRNLMFFFLQKCLYVRGFVSRYAMLRLLRGKRRMAPRGDSAKFWVSFQIQQNTTVITVFLFFLNERNSVWFIIKSKNVTTIIFVSICNELEIYTSMYNIGSFLSKYNISGRYFLQTIAICVNANLFDASENSLEGALLLLTH